jgi:PH (Pleckstrin Homology) domain-containing protein/putative oligomerization/nucleic acid binding protein
MSYADGLLSTGERIAHREKQHWFVLVWGAKLAVAAIILGLILVILSQMVSPDQRAALGTFMGVASAALIIGGLGVLGWHILRYLNQEYVLTNRRVIQVAGVLNKTSMDSSLEKINDARLEQSVFGRIFGFGDLEILTAADTGVDRFRMIRNPIGFKKAMLDAKHEYERDVAGGSYAPSPPLRAEPISRPPAAPPPAAPVTGGAGDDTVSASTPGRAPNAALNPDELTRTLSSLADLRDRGAISPEEYERKKADLLSRL